MGRKAATYACNVANWQELDGLVDAAYAAFGKVDILVNNAGSSPLAPSSLENLRAAFRPHRVAQFQGAVPADVAGRQPYGPGRGRVDHQYFQCGRAPPRPQIAPYAGAKAALNALTEAFAFEYGPKVRVNTISPGRFLTDVSKAWPEEHKANPTAALRRSGQPEEIVTAALYLASVNRASPPDRWSGSTEELHNEDESRRSHGLRRAAALREVQAHSIVEVDLAPPGRSSCWSGGWRRALPLGLSVINGDRPRPVPMAGHEGPGEIVEVGAASTTCAWGPRRVSFRRAAAAAGAVSGPAAGLRAGRAAKGGGRADGRRTSHRAERRADRHHSAVLHAEYAWSIAAAWWSSTRTCRSRMRRCSAAPS